VARTMFIDTVDRGIAETILEYLQASDAPMRVAQLRVLGGAMALLLTWLAATLISRYFIRTEFFDLRLAMLGLLGGAVIGVVGSAVSVGRQIRRVL